MTDDTPTGPLADLGGLLVAYRMAIYLGGLALIGAPLAARSALGYTVPQSARAAITVTVVSVMVLTYLSERRLGIPDDEDEETDTGHATATADAAGDANGSGESYPLWTRAAVAAAVLGLAVGLYLALEGRPLVGLLFVGGAYLFAYLAYERDGATDEPAATMDRDGGGS